MRSWNWSVYVGILGLVSVLLTSCSAQQAAPAAPTQAAPAAAKPAGGAPTAAPANASTGAPTSNNQASGGTLTVIDDLGTENWVLRNATNEQPLWYMGEPLVWWDWDKDQPTNEAILQSWDHTVNPDGSVDWTFKIKPGIKFQKNQGEVTAEDVKFTLAQFMKDGSVNAYTKILRDFYGSDPDNNMKVVDPHTLQIHSPHALNSTELLRAMSAEEARTVRPFPKKYFEQVGEESFARNPVYAGPYEFDSQTPGYELRLKAVPDFYRVKPQFSEIRYLKVQDEATRVAMLRSGQVDIAPIPGRLAGELQSAGIRIAVSKNAIEPFIALGGMFPGRPKFDPSVPWVGQDPLSENSTKVRMALNLAVDRQAIVDKILFGYGRPGVISFSFIGPGNPWWSDDWKPFPYDVQRAKQLLSEAGYPSCFQMNMWLIQGQTFSADVGEAVASMWEKNLGCMVSRRLGEYNPGLRTMIVNRETAGWTYSFQGAPIARPVRYACLNGGPSYQVVVHVELPFYDELCQKADQTLDPADLIQIERQMGDAEYKYLPTVAIATADQPFGVGPRVGDWTPMPKKANAGLLEYAKPAAR
jgi:peptide/nickel transport system substrate-binding protein